MRCTDGPFSRSTDEGAIGIQVSPGVVVQLVPRTLAASSLHIHPVHVEARSLVTQRPCLLPSLDAVPLSPLKFASPVRPPRKALLECQYEAANGQDGHAQQQQYMTTTATYHCRCHPGHARP